MSILKIDNLRATYHTSNDSMTGVDGVSFELEAGEKIGIVGESGSGKTTLLRSILKLIPEQKATLQGSVMFEGRNLLSLDDKELEGIRGSKISIIPQNSAVSLDPVYTIGKQLEETVRLHTDFDVGKCREQAKDLLGKVGLGLNVFDAYPHELSGGMRQRAVISLAIASNPVAILADEITSGLDVIVQDQILDLLDTLQNQMGTAIILVTHDISLVAERCKKIIVMYTGKAVESGYVRDVLRQPSHPYTMLLLRCLPDLDSVTDLVSIPDATTFQKVEGCRFHPRCPFVQSLCSEQEPKIWEANNGQRVACHFAKESAPEFRKLVKGTK